MKKIVLVALLMQSINIKASEAPLGGAGGSSDFASVAIGDVVLEPKSRTCLRNFESAARLMLNRATPLESLMAQSQYRSPKKTFSLEFKDAGDDQVNGFVDFNTVPPEQRRKMFGLPDVLREYELLKKDSKTTDDASDTGRISCIWETLNAPIIDEAPLSSTSTDALAANIFVKGRESIQQYSTFFCDDDVFYVADSKDAMRIMVSANPIFTNAHTYYLIGTDITRGIYSKATPKRVSVLDVDVTGILLVVHTGSFLEDQVSIHVSEKTYLFENAFPPHIKIETQSACQIPLMSKQILTEIPTLLPMKSVLVTSLKRLEEIQTEFPDKAKSILDSVLRTRQAEGFILAD
jgi:hypothetical protein